MFGKISFCSWLSLAYGRSGYQASSNVHINLYLNWYLVSILYLYALNKTVCLFSAILKGGSGGFKILNFFFNYKISTNMPQTHPPLPNPWQTQITFGPNPPHPQKIFWSAHVIHTTLIHTLNTFNFALETRSYDLLNTILF